jgi:hypothetical protein
MIESVVQLVARAHFSLRRVFDRNRAQESPLSLRN